MGKGLQDKEVLRRRSGKPSNATGGNQSSHSNGTKRSKKKAATFCAFSFLTSLFLSIIVFLYVILPATFYYSPTIRRYAVFLNFVSWPPSMNLSDVESFGLDCARNFYLHSDPEVKLGVWHVLPQSQRDSICGVGGEHSKIAPVEKDLFADDRPVIFYVHGNSGTRGGGHRVDLYKILTGANVDAHLITFDYRGYGDSTWVAPTVDGVVRDTKSVYDWLLRHVPSDRIIIWGHSLGTGVTVQLLDLYKDAIRPSRVVLETPFTTLSEVAYHHPLTVFHRHLPYFEHFFIKPAEHSDTYFNSEVRIASLPFPMLILHAEDDGVVPYEHGQRLYRRVKEYRIAKSIKTHVDFKGFSGQLGYGHKYILRDPQLPQIINNFIMQK